MPHQEPRGDSEVVSPKLRNHEIRTSGAEQKLGHEEINLEFGRCYQPKKGGRVRGEDAHFISVDCQAFGVADGVGAWSLRGVDPGRFARQLMRYSKARIEEFPFNRSSESYLGDILESALERTIARGTSTACISVVDGNLLRVANIGDSGVAVVRDGAMAFRSPPGQKNFNYPYQIGRKTPRHSVQIAENFALELVPGDVVVAATDGLFDNVYDWEIAALVTQLKEESAYTTAKDIASALTKAAVVAANDAKRESPFAIASRATRFRFRGGKKDDVTVVVVKVALAKENVMRTNWAPLQAPTEKKPANRRRELVNKHKSEPLNLDRITMPKEDPTNELKEGPLCSEFARVTLAEEDTTNSPTSPN